ncbi:hypothetical protein [Ruminococcus sp. Marseille-P6503]|uniref:hypothetical protein n=1 Tax=Ruminococcus sp. Marseille-P6503 TaxID=2364796 RepID=UPI000F52C105|nr:hypothetical protein [Ruminococcus sp. Marseille-P6503]
MFCRYEDVERLVELYSSSMFCLIYPKMHSRAKALKCIETVYIRYIDASPRLRNQKSEQKWLIKTLRKESGFNALANNYTEDRLTFIERDNMLTSLRVYYNNEGNRPKKRKADLAAAAIVILLCIILFFAAAKGIKHYQSDGGSVQRHLNGDSENEPDFTKRIFIDYED